MKGGEQKMRCDGEVKQLWGSQKTEFFLKEWPGCGSGSKGKGQVFGLLTVLTVREFLTLLKREGLTFAS